MLENADLAPQSAGFGAKLIKDDILALQNEHGQLFRCGINGYGVYQN